MILPISRVMADKQVPTARASRTGLRLFLLLLALVLAGCYPVPYREVSQATPPHAMAPITQVYFYPKAGQTTERQSRDHYECYN
jgi:hypothetical protein